MKNSARNLPPKAEGLSLLRGFQFLILGLGLWILATGCAVGPNYHRPPTNPPTSFRGEAETSTNSFADLPWWQIFQDKTLQSLIQVTLTNNYDLRIATARVEQARAMAAEARSEFFPQLNYQGVAGHGKNVSNNLPSPNGGEGSIFAIDANASWEIDLWGRIRRLSEAARAQYFATQEARRDVLTSLIAQVAQDYFQLLALDRQLQITRDSTNSFGQSLHIFTDRLNGGVASRLETSSAEALMESAAADIPDVERQITLQEDQLKVLLGQNPGGISRTSASLDKQSVPVIPAGLPSALLERRPDIREAEQQLRSANAQVGVAVANFFPQLDLTGLLGAASPELNTFTAGGDLAWSVAAGLTGPIFHGGQLKAQYHEAQAEREQFALQYQVTILNAFEEVADALVSHQKYALVRTAQSRAVDAYQEAVKVANQRYRLGTASYYEVLQEEQSLFPAEDSLNQTEFNQLLSEVQLYRALGGGWKNVEPYCDPDDHPRNSK